MLDKINDGLTIMLIGMGVVFGFLTLMVFVLTFMSKFVMYLNKLFPEAIPEVAKSKKKSSGNDDELVAVAIAAAKRNM